MKTPDTTKAVSSAPNKRKSTDIGHSREVPYSSTTVRCKDDDAKEGRWLYRYETQVLMLSCEIADLIKSPHKHVKRLIEPLIKSGVIDFPPQGIYRDAGHRQSTEYWICQRDSYTIVLQISPMSTVRLVNRWRELEDSDLWCHPQAVAQALGLVANQADQLKAQTTQLAIAAPKVAFFDSYVTSTGDQGIPEVCKLLSVHEHEFALWLESSGVMYRLAGQFTPYAEHLEAKRLVIDIGNAGPTGHTFHHQVKFTPKGVLWIAAEWTLHQQTKGGAI